MIPRATRLKFVWTKGRPPKKKPPDEEERHPAHRAHEVVEREASVAHPADAGDEGHEGADDRHEAADDDGQGAVLLVEGVGLVEVLAIEKPRVLGLEDGRSELLDRSRN